MAGGPAPSGTGGMFSAGSQKAFTSQLKKVYTWYTGGFLVFVVALAILEQMGLPRNWIGYVFLFATVLPLRRHRHHEPHVGRRRVLRCGTARPGGVQRHGDRRRLDERRVVHRHGRHALPDGLRRTRVHHGLDRRLLPGRAVPRALPAQVRAVHDPRLPRRALRRQHSALRRHRRRDPVLVHVRGGADLRRGPHHHAPDRRGVRDRHLPRPRRHPGVLVPRRDARGHVDAGRAVHHPDRRLHDSGGVAVDQAHGRPRAAARLRQGAREGHGARAAADRRPEGEGGPRDLQGARRRREREPREPQRVRRGQGEARGRGRGGQGRERPGQGSHG